jgi:hypothetical protein
VQRDLAAARIAAKKVRRAVKYATFDAWTIGIFGGLSFVCGLFSGISGVVIGAVMGVIAFVEFKGAARVRQLDPTAAKTLGYNQLAFGALLILYALWSMHSVPNLSSLSSQLGQNADMVDTPEVDNWMHMAWYAMYGTVIAVAVFGMGGTALYYFSREKHIREYVQTAAPWVVEMQRSGGPL